MAEELGTGLQNLLHGCKSRWRLQIRASGGIGIHSGLKIRALRHAGSTPASPTKKNIAVWVIFFLVS